ncbi:MAG TPA: hypothetical protein VGD78_16255 [Chthoniobacterales bacterium]
MRVFSCSRSLRCFGVILIGWSVWGVSPANADLFSLFGGGRSATSSGATSDLRQRQIAFLNRLRAADPQHQTIDRAIFNPQNELGLILARSVDLDNIPALMRSVLAQMARAFPGQDATVLAYAPSNPPRKIGTGHLNARTRDMTYTPAQ